MKKIIPVILALCLCISLAACGESGPSTFEKLCNTWQVERVKDLEDMAEDVETLSLFNEGEMEFAPDFYFSYVYEVKFNADHSYSLGVNKEATKEFFTKWSDTMMENLFENREEVTWDEDGEAYGYGDALLECETVEEFCDVYMGYYDNFETYQEYLDHLFDVIWEGYQFEDLDETGTFLVTDKLALTVTGETEAQNVSYKFEDSGELTLGYADNEFETYHIPVPAAPVVIAEVTETEAA